MEGQGGFHAGSRESRPHRRCRCRDRCADGRSGSAHAGTPTKVSTILADFKITPKPASVASGKVIFVARNKGRHEHELVVIRTAKDAATIGLGNGTASEKGALGEVEDVKPGSVKQFTLTLAPGHYVLICNVRKHYNAGMH